MPRYRKPPGSQKKFVTVGLDPQDVQIIEQAMEVLGISQSAAIRMLIRAGARGPAQSPFTPAEGTDHDQ